MPKTPRPPLSSDQARHLRALAHDLKPVVRVGKNGYGPGLEQELDQALVTHELVKVKLEQEATLEVAELCELAERALGTSKVGVIGRTLILYRPHPKKPRIVLKPPAQDQKTRN